jgi:dolichol-phosphate mannosyltransferase
LIEIFVKKWLEGYDVVFGQQIKRFGEPKWRTKSIKFFYKFLKKISDTPIEIDSGDFRLISRKVINEILNMPERARFNRGLITWAGFNSTPIPYMREPRIKGKSSANFMAIFSTALNAITAFSLKPLRLLTIAGIVVTLISIVISVFYAIKAITGNVVPGLTTIYILILLSTGLNMSAIGLLGEYIGRIQLEVKQRPHYIIDKTINL